MGKEKGQRYPKVLSLLQDLNKLRAALEKTERGELSDGKKTPEARKEIERRQATVIFAEVIGYDQLLKSLDPEDAALVMNRCFGMFEAVVRKYGAQIAQITAGNLMILFGVPSAIENAPQKAARAALELLQSLQAFNHEEHLKVILDLRMGIDSGTVITQGGESEEYGVMGEAVQQASQLKDLAGKGQILLSPGARRYTEDAFAFERLKPVIPKGGKTPIPLFRLISAKEDVSQTRIGAERMIHSAMVGRDKEIDQLEFRVLKVVNGEGGIVNIVGEAGIGKSRLIAELIRKNAMTKTTFLVGRALSIGKNLSFHPIIDILKELGPDQRGRPARRFRPETRDSDPSYLSGRSGRSVPVHRHDDGHEAGREGGGSHPGDRRRSPGNADPEEPPGRL